MSTTEATHRCTVSIFTQTPGTSPTNTADAAILSTARAVSLTSAQSDCSQRTQPMCRSTGQLQEYRRTGGSRPRAGGLEVERRGQPDYHPSVGTAWTVELGGAGGESQGQDEESAVEVPGADRVTVAGSPEGPRDPSARGSCQSLSR